MTVRSPSRTSGGLALVAVALLAGCSGASSHPTRIEGRFVFSSGVVPGQRPVPGQITVTGTNFREVVTVRADGNFRLSVPPGEYTLVGRSSHFIVNGAQAPCFVDTHARVDVLAGVTAHVVVLCEGK